MPRLREFLRSQQILRLTGTTAGAEQPAGTIIRLRTAVWSCAWVSWPLRYARDLSESQPMKETTSVGSRRLSPQGLGYYGAKVLPETAGLGGGKGSLGHTGGLSTVTTGRFNFTGSAGLAFPSSADLRASRLHGIVAAGRTKLGEMRPLFSEPSSAIVQ